MEYRRLGLTDLCVSAVGFGAWPISGMSSVDVNDADSLATIAACLDAGVNFFDTAYCYGVQGESERLLARALGAQRGEVVLATKGGIEWGPGRKQVLDASPATLRRQCETSLNRLESDCVDLLYLHAPDPKTPVADSAGELARLMQEGKARAIGASNCTVEQLAEFASVCPLAAVQPAYNMLQREIEQDVVPWCVEQGVAIVVYWPLLKGLLAGRLPREHVFAAGDGRAKYPMFQGAEWQKNQDFVDRLRPIAAEAGLSVAQLVINWTIQQPGITCALCGAKRSVQAIENAGGAAGPLADSLLARIDAALAERGAPQVRLPV
jgi:aryl-alcohol dehydrogenase-like predicted oxidoreductase